MDFALATRQAEALVAAMTKRLPGAEAQIASELDRFLTDLSALDDTARTIGARVKGLSVIASHSRYQYFGRVYGLDLSTVDRDARETPTEDQWRALEPRVAKTGAKLFIWEAEPLPEARDRVREMGLVDLVLPPLANRPGTRDFAGTMAASLERLDVAVPEAKTALEWLREAATQRIVSRLVRRFAHHHFCFLRARTAPLPLVLQSSAFSARDKPSAVSPPSS